jgi:hypothetical protein
MNPLKGLQLLLRRTGRTGHHLVDPHGKPVATDGGNRYGRQQHRCQK